MAHDLLENILASFVVKIHNIVVRNHNTKENGPRDNKFAQSR